MVGLTVTLAPLILVVGPSGVGKDALIAGARLRLLSDPRFRFPRRFVTRPSVGGSEDHEAISPSDFARRHAEGAFLLSWQAHGLGYGIPAVAAQGRAEGVAVVINVSRHVILQAERELSPIRVVAVTAPDTVLAARLAARGRESAAEIESRLRRAAPSLPRDAVIVDNGGSLDQGIQNFVDALRLCHPS